MRSALAVLSLIPRSYLFGRWADFTLKIPGDMVVEIQDS